MDTDPVIRTILNLPAAFSPANAGNNLNQALYHSRLPLPEITHAALNCYKAAISGACYGNTPVYSHNLSHMQTVDLGTGQLRII